MLTGRRGSGEKVSLAGVPGNHVWGREHDVWGTAGHDIGEPLACADVNHYHERDVELAAWIENCMG